MKRIDDLSIVYPLLSPYLSEIKGLNLETWLQNSCNYCLINKYNDLSLFESVGNKAVEGHYFFKSRGNQALKEANRMLEYIFSTEIGTVRGITPVELRGAAWMSRQLGFKSYGFEETIVGLCEIFILTKEDYKGSKEHE
jgi:hypothetical protein